MFFELLKITFFTGGGTAIMGPTMFPENVWCPIRYRQPVAENVYVGESDLVRCIKSEYLIFV